MQVGTYPTRNFALAIVTRVLVDAGPGISAGLCMSPCSTDFIFTDHSVPGVKSLRILRNSGSFCRLICLANKAIR